MYNTVVLLTGASKGIGKHLAERFYSLNYKVIATDIDINTLKNNFDNWDSERAIIEKLDVTKVEDWQNVITCILEKFGKLDICINNAGVLKPNFIANMTVQEIDFQIDVNVKGVLYGSKLTADLMMRQGFGHLINLSSLAGVSPIHGMAIYSATKHAVRGFTLSIVPELRSKGVYASVICPDLVNTDMLTNQLTDPAAGLLFSGNKHLTVLDIEKAVFNKALRYKKIEILLPISRGIMAKISSFSPAIGLKLTQILEKIGNKKRDEINNKIK